MKKTLGKLAEWCLDMIFQYPDQAKEINGIFKTAVRKEKAGEPTEKIVQVCKNSINQLCS